MERYGRIIKEKVFEKETSFVQRKVSLGQQKNERKNEKRGKRKKRQKETELLENTRNWKYVRKKLEKEINKKMKQEKNKERMICSWWRGKMDREEDCNTRGNEINAEEPYHQHEGNQ